MHTLLGGGYGGHHLVLCFLLVWNMQLQTILYNLVIRIGVPTSIILLFQLVAEGTEVGQGRVMDCKMDKHNYSKHACISNTIFLREG
jgi:hypothetical protein